jgi:hypothetical protein
VVDATELEAMRCIDMLFHQQCPCRASSILLQVLQIDVPEPADGQALVRMTSR